MLARFNYDLLFKWFLDLPIDSPIDPEALLARNSSNTAASLCYAGHLLMENRNARIVDIELTQADGYAERGGSDRDARATTPAAPPTDRRHRQGL